MGKTWKGTTAGIMSIIGGIFGIVTGAIALSVGSLISYLSDITGMFGMGGLGGGFLALGIIALIGGIVTLKRKAWGFCLAGAICAMFPIIPLGVMAIIFVAMGKKEFVR
ncbi:MAG: hypothetical protein R6T78_02160 [Dehalococcoidales bacterium]